MDDHGDIITKFENIFGKVLEHEVIKMVLSSCSWNIKLAYEQLLNIIHPEDVPKINVKGNLLKEELSLPENTKQNFSSNTLSHQKHALFPSESNMIKDIICKIQSQKHVMVIMRGLPGSGKSFLAYSIINDGTVLSTDDYFYDNFNNYNFNAYFLQSAHEWNHERAHFLLSKFVTPIFIDNTNLELWEFLPYIKSALQFNYDIDLLEPETPWRYDCKELSKRNVHNISEIKIEKMMQRFDTSLTNQNIIRNINVASCNKENLPKVSQKESPDCAQIDTVDKKQQIIRNGSFLDNKISAVSLDKKSIKNLCEVKKETNPIFKTDKHNTNKERNVGNIKHSNSLICSKDEQGNFGLSQPVSKELKTLEKTKDIPVKNNEKDFVKLKLNLSQTSIENYNSSDKELVWESEEVHGLKSKTTPQSFSKPARVRNKHTSNVNVNLSSSSDDEEAKNSEDCFWGPVSDADNLWEENDVSEKVIPNCTGAIPKVFPKLVSNNDLEIKKKKEPNFLDSHVDHINDTEASCTTKEILMSLSSIVNESDLQYSFDSTGQHKNNSNMSSLSKSKNLVTSQKKVLNNVAMNGLLKNKRTTSSDKLCDELSFENLNYDSSKNQNDLCQLNDIPEFVTINIDETFSSQLLSMYGPIVSKDDSENFTSDNRKLVLPNELCYKIYQCWAGTIKSKNKVQNKNNDKTDSTIGYNNFNFSEENVLHKINQLQSSLLDNDKLKKLQGTIQGACQIPSPELQLYRDPEEESPKKIKKIEAFNLIKSYFPHNTIKDLNDALVKRNYDIDSTIDFILDCGFKFEPNEFDLFLEDSYKFNTDVTSIEPNSLDFDTCSNSLVTTSIVSDKAVLDPKYDDNFVDSFKTQLEMVFMDELQLLTMAIDDLFAHQLVNIFGPVTSRNLSSHFTKKSLNIRLPIHLCFQIYHFWADSLEEEYKSQTIIEKDEALAKKLQKIEDKQVKRSEIINENVVALLSKQLPKKEMVSSRTETVTETSIKTNDFNKLIKEFEWMKIRKVEQAFKNNNLDIDATRNALRSKKWDCRNHSIIQHFAPSYRDVLVSTSGRSYTKGNNRKLKEICSQPNNPQEYRDEATLHLCLANEAMHQSRAAWKQGLNGVATYYNQVAHMHRQKYAGANDRAARKILSVMNEHLDENTLDLHLLQSKEALRVTTEFLLERESFRESNGLDKLQLAIITGSGAHSSGPAVLKPLIGHLLKTKKNNFKAFSGYFVVLLGS